jgi:hypothetical protein
MLFIFSTPVLIRHLWQLKTVVFQQRCLICAVLLVFGITMMALGTCFGCQRLLSRHLWQLKTVVFMHWCLIHAVLLVFIITKMALGTRLFCLLNCHGCQRLLSRHLWQLKTVVFLHWCLICAVLLVFGITMMALGVGTCLFCLLNCYGCQRLLSRHLWQLKTVVFLHRCLIRTVPLTDGCVFKGSNPATIGTQRLWKRISCKQNTRWQHISRLKASAFLSLQKKISC